MREMSSMPVTMGKPGTRNSTEEMKPIMWFGLTRPAATSTLTTAMYRPAARKPQAIHVARWLTPRLSRVERKNWPAPAARNTTEHSTRPPRFRNANPAQATAEASASIQRVYRGLAESMRSSSAFASAGVMRSGSSEMNLPS